MSTHSIDESTIPAREPSSEVTGSAVHGALTGLVPLGLFAGFVALAIVLTALARQLAAGSGFFAQQEAALSTLIAGLVLAIVVFAIAVWRVLRQVAAWQQAGVAVQANAALWALGATALIIVIPVPLGLLLPQYPAP
jgi:succinate dehydrogenase/fumarate reductase cytochrome b subunit